MSQRNTKRISSSTVTTTSCYHIKSCSSFGSTVMTPHNASCHSKPGQSWTYEGVYRVDEEVEENFEPAVGRACVAQPEKLSSVECGILKRVKEEFGVLNFVGLEGFVNVRDVYKWKGLKLEVDKTLYEFVTCHEIECETSDPEGVKKVLEEFLKENGIQ